MFIAPFSCALLLLGGSADDTSPTPEVSRPSSPFQLLVNLVGSPIADAIKQGEEAHAALAKSGAAPVAASYALALLYVRENRLDQAAATLDGLANSSKLAPPILRLRLYLAWERHEVELAGRLLSLLKDQVLAYEGTDSERLQSARLLGGFIGALPDEGTRLLKQAEVNALADALGSAVNKNGDKNIASAFRLAQSQAAKRKKELQALLASAPDTETAQRAVDAAIGELDEVARSLQETKVELTTTLRDNQEASGEATGKLRQLGQQVRNLEREWGLETPGRPRQPIRPIEPKRPTQSKGKDDRDKDRRDMSDYEREMVSYREALRKFNAESATFPQRLQAWQWKDQQRREQLMAHRKQADADITAIRAEEKERDQEVDRQRLEIKRQTIAMQEADFKVQFLRSVASGEAAQEGWLSRPSHYGLLSFSAERQRLMQARP